MYAEWINLWKDRNFKAKKKFFDAPSLALTCKKSMKKRRSFAATNIHTLHLYFSSFKLSFFISISLSIPSSLSFPPWMFIYTSCQIDCISITVAFKAIVTAYLSPPFSFFVFFLLHESLWLLSFFICMVSKPFSPTQNWFPFPYPIRLSVNIVIFSICTRLKNNHVFSACLTRDF